MKYFSYGILIIVSLLILVNAPQLLLFIGLVAFVYLLGRITFAPKENKIPKPLKKLHTPMEQSGVIIKGIGKTTVKNIIKSFSKTYKKAKKRTQDLKNLESQQAHEQEASELQERLRKKM